MTRFGQRRLRLAAALATVPAAVVVSYSLEGVFGNVFMMFPLVSVLAVGLLVGTRWALVSVPVQTLLHAYLFFFPHGMGTLGHEPAKLATFLLVGAVVALVSGRVHLVRERLEAEQEKAVDALSRVRWMSGLATQFSAAGKPAQVAEVAFRGCRGLSATVADIAWVSPDSGALETLFGFGHPDLAEGLPRCSAAEPLPNGVAFRRGAPVFVDSPERIARDYPALAHAAQATGTRTWLSWPLVLRGQAVGALGVGFARAGPLPPAELEVLAAVAEHAAQALDRAFLLARSEESERRFRLLAENAPDLVYRIRLQPTPGYEYVSPSATAMTGYTPEEHYADPELGSKLVDPDDLPLLEQVKQGTAPDPLLVRWRRRDGKVIWTEQRNVVFRDAAGAPTAIEGIARDVTQRIEVERERERLVSDREDLLRAVSHDFRTPIQAVMLRSESILRDPGDREKAIRNARAILDSARRMSAAVQDVVHLARLTAGGLLPRREVIPVEPFVHELTRRLFSDADLSRIEVAIPPFAVAADPDHLERIVTNLVENALKYCDPPGRVRIAARPDGAELILSVIDDGPGIPPEDVPHLFQRYFRGSRHSGREGTGLGLFVTRMLAEAQGGRVWVESELGRGSAFHVRLPAG